MGLFDIFTGKKKEQTQSVQVRKGTVIQHRSEFPAPSIDFARNRGLYVSVNQDLYLNLERTRMLSRYLCTIDPYLARYVEIISVFVVGQDGLRLEPACVGPSGRLAEKVNATIKRKWKDWGQVATYDETLSFSQVEQLVIRTVARDGEALVRMITGNGVNQYGFALQVLDPSLLDVTYNRLLSNKNTIIMGIEFDPKGRRVAYHIWTRLLQDVNLQSRTRERIAAEEIIHIIDTETPGQVRALPWTTPVLNTVSRLNQFLEVHLQACSIAATTPLVMTNEQPDVVGVDDVAVSNVVPAQVRQPEINLAYNQILELDHGKSLAALNLQFPRQGFAETTSQYLKAIASGLFVSYATLTADPAGGNSANVRFSSVVEREHFAQLQRWIIKSFHFKVYKKWIENSLLFGAIDLPSMNADDYMNVNFRSNRQSTIDPSKDMRAYIDGIANGIYTRSQICAETGGDFFDNIKQLALEEEYIAKYGVNIANNAEKPLVPLTDEEVTEILAPE